MTKTKKKNPQVLNAASSWTLWRTECRSGWSHASHSLHCKEFHFLPSEGKEVSVTAWWMVFLCARCLRSEIIPCGREACGVLFFFFSCIGALAAISAALPLHWLYDRAAVCVYVSFWYMWLWNLRGHNWRNRTRSSLKTSLATFAIELCVCQ